MNLQIDDILNKLVDECLSAPAFATLDAQQKEVQKQKILNHFYTRILFITIDNLTDEQYGQIQDLKPEDPQFEQKIESFTQEMPQLLDLFDQTLKKDADYIKNTGQLPSLEEDQSQNPL